MLGRIQYFLANLDLTKYNRLTKRLDNSVDEAHNEDMAPSKCGMDKYQGQKPRQSLPMLQSRSRRDWTMVFTESSSMPKRWELCTDEIMKSSPMLKSSWQNGIGGESIQFLRDYQQLRLPAYLPKGKYLLYCTPSTCLRLLHQSLRLSTHPYNAHAVQKTCRWHQTHLSLPEASRTTTAGRQYAR